MSARESQPWPNYSFVKRLEFISDFEGGSNDLIVELAEDLSDDSPSVRLSFRRVSKLTVREIGGGCTQFCELLVEDVRDRQWDQVHYRVYQGENQEIDFYCRSYEVHAGADES